MAFTHIELNYKRGVVKVDGKVFRNVYIRNWSWSRDLQPMFSTESPFFGSCVGHEQVGPAHTEIEFQTQNYATIIIKADNAIIKVVR